MYGRYEWKELALHIINNWILVRRSMYFILIKDIFYCNKKREIMIKYQCSNKRIGDVISLSEFMQSPLKNATHPDQMIQIGMQLERQLNLLQEQNSKDGNNRILIRFIGSTALGVLIDNSIFTLLAYTPLFLSNHISFTLLPWLIISQYFIKICYETLMSPYSIFICTV